MNNNGFNSKNIIRMKNQKGFTLIEMLIVTVIIGILFVLLFNTYIKISQISFRVEQEKVVAQELVYLSQVLQNFSDRNSINFDIYSGDLVDSNGFADILYLTGEDGMISLYTTGDCKTNLVNSEKGIDMGESPQPPLSRGSKGCWFEIANANENSIIAITNTGNVSFTKAVFRIIPYVSEEQVLNDDDLCKTNYFACLHSDGFWLFTIAHIPYYSDVWSNRVKTDVEYFFNL